MAYDELIPSKEKLYVVTSIFNPDGQEIRYKLYRDFKKYINSFPNTILVTIELAFGDSPFAVTDSSDPYNIQLRTDTILFYKENLLNIAFKTLPKDAKVAWIDADIEFKNVNWVNDTIKALDTYKFVQLLDGCESLGPDNEIIIYDRGFVYNWIHKPDTPKKRGRSGLAWASAIKTLESVGWLIDWDIVGASDWFLVFGLTNQKLMADTPCKKKNEKWSELVKQYVNANVGYIEGTVVHFFHGWPSDRGYVTRGKILIDNHFDPDVDVGYREGGLMYFSTEKPKLQQGIIEYFKSTKVHGPGETPKTTLSSEKKKV